MRDTLIVFITVVTCGIMCWVSFGFGFNSGTRKATIDALEALARSELDKIEVEQGFKNQGTVWQ